MKKLLVEPITMASFPSTPQALLSSLSLGEAAQVIKFCNEIIPDLLRRIEELEAKIS